jgi:hypothetical protein
MTALDHNDFLCHDIQHKTVFGFLGIIAVSDAVRRTMLLLICLPYLGRVLLFSSFA